MDKRFLTETAAAALTAFLALTACSHDGHSHAEATEAEEHAHSSDEIVLEPEAAERFGVVADTLVAADFHEVTRVTGRILDTPSSASVVAAPTAGIVRFTAGLQEGSRVGAGAVIATVSAEGLSGGDSNKADLAALEAARRELERLRPLRQDGIVSEKDYNAALEAYETAASRYSSAAASGHARAIAGGTLAQLLVANGQYVEAGTPIATVAANTRLTLRADVPDRLAACLPTVTTARISLPGSDETIDLAEMGGRRLAADATRQTPGYVPVYFSFDSHGRVLPQTLVEVYLLGARRSGVLSVPLEAVVEQQGHRFVFAKVDDEGYEKRPVTLGATDGRRVEIKDGVKAGEAIVVKGATAVRLAESAGAVPEGHSHSH